jgi:hypothetical protein
MKLLLTIEREREREEASLATIIVLICTHIPVYLLQRDMSERERKAIIKGNYHIAKKTTANIRKDSEHNAVVIIS